MITIQNFDLAVILVKSSEEMKNTRLNQNFQMSARRGTNHIFQWGFKKFYPALFIIIFTFYNDLALGPLFNIEEESKI